MCAELVTLDEASAAVRLTRKQLKNEKKKQRKQQLMLKAKGKIKRATSGSSQGEEEEEEEEEQSETEERCHAAAEEEEETCVTPKDKRLAETSCSSRSSSLTDRSGASLNNEKARNMKAVRL